VVLALGAVAVGSFLYHGPQPAWADAAHDASIALLLGALASRGGAHGSMRDRRRATVVVVVLAAALLVVAVPRSVAAVHGALAGLVAAHARDAAPQRCRPAARVALVALVAGVVLFALGRTGGPLCEPRALLQPHAGWHVATAIAAAALVTVDVPPRRRPPMAP
jgi:hypothetical protein